MPSYCRHCGRAVSEGLSRCDSCGAPLNGTLREKNVPIPGLSTEVKESPKDLFEYALQLVSRDALDDAILQLKRALKVDPNFVPALALLGDLYGRIGEKEKAVDYFDRALALDKDYEPARLGKEALLSQPSPLPYPGSATEADQRWMGHPFPLIVATFIAIGLLMGTRLIKSYNDRSQPGTYQPPITIAPESPGPATAPPSPPPVPSLIQRGFAAFNEGRFQEASALFRSALERDPSNQEARTGYLLAEAALKEERTGRRLSVSAVPSPRTPGNTTWVQPVAPPSATVERTQTPTTSTPLYLPSPVTTPSGTPPPPIPAPQTSSSPIPSGATYAIRPEEVVSVPSQPTPPPPRPDPLQLEREAQDLIWSGQFEAAAGKIRTLLSLGVPENREGEIRQQLALILQRLGRFSEAAAEYERAINAYRRQIEKGQDVPTARKGMQVCQQGLGICRQSR